MFCQTGICTMLFSAQAFGELVSGLWGVMQRKRFFVHAIPNFPKNDRKKGARRVEDLNCSENLA